MKTILPILLLFCAFSMTSQSNVTLKINHLLEEAEFELGMVSKNNLENKFMLERLEYYLSTFSITHDGGQVTPIEDLYVLITMDDKKAPTEIDLGTFDIQNLESVQFYFGIDEEANHADPSLWPSDHPLAPKFPSMHWGWASGYRFIALEGQSGESVDQELQFHCIGDEFYEELSFPAEMSGSDSYVVEIDAEYTELLADIDISGGLILHGNLGHIKTLANNLKDNVFTSKQVSSTTDSDLVNTFIVYPNPSQGQISVRTDVEITDFKVSVSDVLGRKIDASLTAQGTINITQSGIYFVSLLDKNGDILATRKLLIQ
ncbi:MAG: T9SS type A sorting domain-containing protein [Saprospiraceae bacterium]|nr:T9SS type A sorting domain-containing protein [Saprospiraceae bacterium]